LQRRAGQLAWTHALFGSAAEVVAFGGRLLAAARDLGLKTHPDAGLFAVS
jgi:hypothetical protein